MPTTYSHMAFGERVLNHLSHDEEGKKLLEQILPWKDDFMVGTHGPDLMFYYRALVPNSISAIGKKLHRKSADSLFEKLRQIAADVKPGFAYAMGVVCHYILDYRCHPYVEKYKVVSGISHGEIEMEMDWQMMLTDGHDPMHYKPADSLRLSKELCKPLETIYPGASAAQIEKAAKSMVFYCNLGVCPNNHIRKLIMGTMKAIGLEELSKGHVICPERNPDCEESTQWLCNKLEDTVAESVELIKAYAGYLRGEQKLPEIFSGTFLGPMTE